MMRAHAPHAIAVAALLLGPSLEPRTARANVQDEDFLEALGDVALFVETDVLVSGATRRVLKLSEAPGTITVVDGQELREWGALTLEEALRYVTSVTFAPGEISLTTRVRDIEQSFANKMLVLIDGRIVNGVFRGNAHVDLSQPIDNVARIEIVRGPGSALYGANAFAGFINVVTRKGDEIDGVEVRVTGGNDSLLHASVLTGGRKGGGNWTLDVRGATRDGSDPVSPDDENASHDDAHVAFRWGGGDSKGETWFAGVTYDDVEAGVPGTFEFPRPEDRLRERRLSLDAFRAWEPSSKTKLKLRGYYNRQDNQYWFRRADVTLTPIGDQLIDRTFRIAYDPEIQLIPETSFQPNPAQEPDPDCIPCDEVVLGLSLPPVGLATGSDAATFFDIRDNGLPQVTDSVPSDEWQGFLELQADWQVSRSNYLLGGVSVRVDDLDNSIVGQRQFKNYAVFVEDEQRFFDEKLILLGSLRVDDHSLFGISVSPRVSLIWSPSEKLIMKSAYGRAFRSPNFVELFGQTNVGTARLFGAEKAVEEGVLPATFERCRMEGVPLSECPVEEIETLDAALDQEEIETIELWTEYTPNDRFRLIVNLYEFVIENEIGIAVDRNDIYYFADGPAALEITSGVPLASFIAFAGLRDQPTLGVFLNAPDRTRGRGVELEVHGDPTDWLGLKLKYSLRDNRRGEVREFVEANQADANSQALRPTFGKTSFSADQLTGLVTLRRGESFWASLRLRWLGRPGRSFLDGGEGFSSDLTVGFRRKNLTVAGTVLNLNEGQTLFDPVLDDFIDSPADVRLLVGYEHEF